MYFLEQMFQKLKRHNLGNRAREAVPQMPHRRHATDSSKFIENCNQKNKTKFTTTSKAR